MPVSLKQNMNVEIREMINRDPWSLKQPIHFLGIIFALVAFICVLEFFVIPSQDHLSTNLRFLVSGACLLTWASTLSRSFAFYFICSHLYGLFMASFLLFYQVVKRLPKKLSSSAVFLYSTLIGLTVVSLPYIPGWFEVIRETYAITRKFRNVGELAMVINIRFFETQFGLIAINSELLLAYDGSIDIGISRVMSWFIRIWATVLIIQSSEDTRLAVGALVCVLVVSPLLRMITRLIFPDRGTLMAKLLIMRDAIRDAVGPFVWCLIIVQIYSHRLKEGFVRSYGKSVRKKMKMKMKKRLETSVTVGESHTLVSHFPTPPRIKFSSGKVYDPFVPNSYPSGSVLTVLLVVLIIEENWFKPQYHQFSSSLWEHCLGPGPDARVVYIAGAFDLFHAGHVEILRRARELGDFLLVGIHNDQTVSAKRGGHPPIMSMQERSLSVGACRYVDEVIFGAPWEVSKNTITIFGISLVVHGTVAESDNFQRKEENPYAVPISMGIFQILESPLDITTSTIMGRIVANHEAYQASCYSSYCWYTSPMSDTKSFVLYRNKRNLKKEASDDEQMEKEASDDKQALRRGTDRAGSLGGGDKLFETQEKLIIVGTIHNKPKPDHLQLPTPVRFSEVELVLPTDIQKMASYVFNNNYLKNGLADEACSFNNNAALTSINPSQGTCRYHSSRYEPWLTGFQLLYLVGLFTNSEPRRGQLAKTSDSIILNVDGDDNKSAIFGKHDLGKLLGSGAFAKVYQAEDLHNDRESVAIKVVQKKRLKDGLTAQVKREISVMCGLRHPHIVLLSEVLDTKTKKIFVMELAKGGELFPRVSSNRFTEGLSRKYFRQLISAVRFPILVSARWRSRSNPTGCYILYVGPPAYVAPELLTKKGYDGYMVMRRRFVSSQRRLLTVSRFKHLGTLPENPNGSIHHAGVDFSGANESSEKRITVEEILKDPWFNHRVDPSEIVGVQILVRKSESFCRHGAKAPKAMPSTLRDTLARRGT
uniref:ethanolamine-phosphate cytidylyltransferase n=1 Tax=Brassica oleracea var. oleracea TaxID=109376 RepID=A0A0D3DCB5_BRAOL